MNKEQRRLQKTKNWKAHPYQVEAILELEEQWAEDGDTIYSPQYLHSLTRGEIRELKKELEGFYYERDHKRLGMC